MRLLYAVGEGEGILHSTRSRKKRMTLDHQYNVVLRAANGFQWTRCLLARVTSSSRRLPYSFELHLVSWVTLTITGIKTTYTVKRLQYPTNSPIASADQQPQLSDNLPIDLQPERQKMINSRRPKSTDDSEVKAHPNFGPLRLVMSKTCRGLSSQHNVCSALAPWNPNEMTIRVNCVGNEI